MKKCIALILVALLALSMASAFATEYTDKDTVKIVQQALNDAGYNCGTPDGSAGKKTKAAIMDYQTANGLEQTGVIDDALLTALGLVEVSGEEAEAENDDSMEITFQGVPWDSTPDEVYQALLDQNIIDEEKNSHYNPSDNVTCWPESDNDGIHYVLGDFYGGYKYYNPIKTIGGYETLNGIYFQYLYGIEDGQISQTPLLKLVDFTLIIGDESSNFDEKYDALEDAFRQVYGQGISGRSELWGTRFSRWTGADNTGIYISGIGNIGGQYCVEVVYAKADMLTTMNTMREINENNKLEMEDTGF